MTARHLETLNSAVTTMRSKGHERRDPFYEDLFGGSGGGAEWLTRSALNAQKNLVPANRMGIAPTMLLDERTAWRETSRMTGRGLRLTMLGALDQWRTMTGPQLAALTGCREAQSINSAEMGRLFAVGAVDHGLSSGGIMRTMSRWQRTELWRPAKTVESFERKIRPYLTTAEHVGLTGGQPMSSNRQFDRHNVLTVEFALRYAEYTELAGVLGEKISLVDLLFSGHPSWRGVVSNKTADAVLVRKDGMRIAIEMTASVSKDFSKKVLDWVLLLRDNPLEASGVTLLFVDASRPGVAGVFHSIKKAVQKSLQHVPGSLRREVAGRIGVARWVDIFPGPHMVHEFFEFLPAHVATGSDAEPWRLAGMLDTVSVPFEPRDAGAMMCVVKNCSLLAGSPHWLREQHIAPDMWTLGMVRAGVHEIPELAMGTEHGETSNPPTRLQVLSRVSKR